MTRARLWRLVRTNWPFVVLALAVLPLLWMAFSIAVRSGLFGLSEPLDSGQLGVFLTFTGASLGTAATAFAALLTQAHNAREQHRLRLETVIKSLESLPAETPKPRLAGVLSTMVLLGQERIAIRVLHPAWTAGQVDDGTATWLIGQVLKGDLSDGEKDGDRVDESALCEAAALLVTHAEQLTGEKPLLYYFPGQFQRRWKTDNYLPTEVKEHLLLAMGLMLASRDKSWWCPHGDLPQWPTAILVKCFENEDQPKIRACAAVLLAPLQDIFPKQFQNRLGSKVGEILGAAAVARAKSSVGTDIFKAADRIKAEWQNPAEGGEERRELAGTGA